MKPMSNNAGTLLSGKLKNTDFNSESGAYYVKSNYLIILWGMLNFRVKDKTTDGTYKFIGTDKSVIPISVYYKFCHYNRSMFPLYAIYVYNLT